MDDTKIIVPITDNRRLCFIGYDDGFDLMLEALDDEDNLGWIEHYGVRFEVDRVAGISTDQFFDAIDRLRKLLVLQ